MNETQQVKALDILRHAWIHLSSEEKWVGNNYYADAVEPSFGDPVSLFSRDAKSFSIRGAMLKAQLRFGLASDAYSVCRAWDELLLALKEILRTKEVLTSKRYETLSYARYSHIERAFSLAIERLKKDVTR